MVVDFHTHVFPDKIAEKTVETLKKRASIEAYTVGRFEELKKSMKCGGVDVSVILPVVTKPSQFNSINEYAATITGKDGIISFGGIHPDTENYKEELDTIKKLGLLGIKLHPDYQNCFIDDERYINIINYATKLELIVSIHAGVDVGLPKVVHCTPERSVRMLEHIDGDNKKIILAHTGGYMCWDEVERLIAGRKDVYLDCSYTLGLIDDEQFMRIVSKHGADRILFATDSPWKGQKEDLEYIKSMGFSDEELKRILCENASDLLGKKNLLDALGL